MTNFLRPYSEFEAHDLAQQLHGLVVRNANFLYARNMLGLLARYGTDIELAEQAVARGQNGRGDTDFQHYALVDESGDVTGAASVIPELPLRAQIAPVPPLLAIWPLSQEYDFHSNLSPANVAAWVDASDDSDKFRSDMAGAYSAAARETAKNLTDDAFYGDDTIRTAWTIEPRMSPRIVHQAITDAAMQEVAVGRFDDNESRRQVPPKASLYVWPPDLYQPPRITPSRGMMDE